MVSQYPSNRYFLFNPKPSGRYFACPAPSVEEVNPHGGWIRGLAAPWRTFGINTLAKQLELDIYHGLSHELPMGAKGNTKWVLTVHDLIFMRFPHYFSRIDVKLYTYKIKKACQKADRIIAISEQTKSDLVHYLGVAATKIAVVYQDCHPAFKLGSSDGQRLSVKQRYALPDRFVLQVGTIEARKNLLLSVRALAQVQEGVHLVVVGRKTPYLQEVEQEIQALSLHHRVHLIHDVGFEDLPALYQLAEVFLYPSRFEGFGIPIIEALNSGTVVIAATGSCLEEAGGPDSIYVHPDDKEAMAAAMENMLNHPSKRAERAEKGRIFAQRFDGKLLAAKLMENYLEVYEGRH